MILVLLIHIFIHFETISDALYETNTKRTSYLLLFGGCRNISSSPFSTLSNSTVQKHTLCLSPAHPPGSDEVQQVLPALTDFGEFVLDLSSFAVLAGSGQALAHNLQLLLILLSHADLLLVVLGERQHAA